MQIFFSLLSKLIPLYFLIVLGYFAGKYLGAHKESIAKMLIYIITPFVVFHGVYTSDMNIEVLSLPLLFWIWSSAICLLFFSIGKKIWNDSTKNILAMAAGSGNVGYFGLPVALALFGKEILGIYVFSILGMNLYENSVGFFIAAKGKHSGKESLKKLVKLPPLYAFFLGVTLNVMNVKLGDEYHLMAEKFTGAYTIFGMMLIGIALANIEKWKPDGKFLSLIFCARFVVWPSLAFLLVFLDRNYFSLYNEDIYKIIILISIVPIAANTVAYATALRAKPEKASMAVLLTTVFALLYIPVMVMVFL